jgi:hypothetical protein
MMKQNTDILRIIFLLKHIASISTIEIKLFIYKRLTVKIHGI